MIWSEEKIATTLARQIFQRKCLVVVPNCSWTGDECDLLAVTKDLRVIDVEVKISRSDYRADAKKDGSSDFPMGNLSRIQIKPAAVEIDGDLEVVTVPESTGTFLYSCNL